MRYIGCHLASSAGFAAMGRTALSIGANTFQFFTRNPRGSKAKAIDPDDAAAFLALAQANGFGRLVAHAPYTINPCSKTERTREFARMTLADDLKRMEYLPGNYYNFHPGSHTEQGMEVGISQIAETLNAILKPEQHTTVLLETMSGKGSEVGGRFEELREILDKRLPTLNRWRQKQETSSLHHKMIQNIIVYINGHLTEVLNTDTLSSMSGLSKFHFRRVFRTATGENIGSYIQRLRMEHVAHLLISTDYTLKQIIEQTSYQTKYSIAKAFKKHFGISTSQYREKHRPNGENPATNIKPEIKVISPIKIFCIEVGEAYKNKLKYRLLWNKLLHHAEQYEADPRYDKFISLSMDDPSITPTEKCRFYLGITLRDDTKARPVPGIMQIPGGRYAVFRHTGSYSSLHKVYRSIYEEWFPKSKYHPQSTFSFEMYMNHPSTTETSELLTEIYLSLIHI